MSTYDEWNRLAARVRGLVSASELSASLFAKQEDALGTLANLGRVAQQVTASVNGFGGSLDISESVVKRKIHDTVERIWTLIDPATGSASSSAPGMRENCIRSALVALAGLEAEVSYLLSDRQSEIRQRAERAFAHLQRSIVVDETARQKWDRAFQAGEVECERLGAVHLLSHGIWAFKVNASGGRTDLVYQEPMHDIGTATRSSEGLVLTEWKKMKEGREPNDCFAAARGQAKSYSSGVLAGTELARVRYAIVVSRMDIEVPDDALQEGISYRHINVAVDPRVPSKR